MRGEKEKIFAQEIREAPWSFSITHNPNIFRLELRPGMTNAERKKEMLECFPVSVHCYLLSSRILKNLDTIVAAMESVILEMNAPAVQKESMEKIAS